MYQNNMQKWSVHCVILYGFSNAHTLMFFDQRRSKLWSRDGLASKFRSSGPPKGPIPTEKGGHNGEF